MTPQEHIEAAQELVEITRHDRNSMNHQDLIQLGQLHAMIANVQLQDSAHQIMLGAQRQIQGE